MNKDSLYTLIGAIILLIAAVVGYNIAYNTVGAESLQVMQIQRELVTKDQDSTQIAQAKAELASLTSDESTIDQYFVATNNVVPFLEQLQTTGTYLGSKVQVVSVSATPGTPYGHLSLSLSINGSFDAVLRTLGAIEYGPYDTEINSVTLSAADPSSAASAPQQWTANAVFSIGTKVGTPIVAPVAATSSMPKQTQAANPVVTPTSTSTSANTATIATTTGATRSGPALSN